MSFKHLDSLFKPQSIAVIGASNASNRPGFAVMRNLLQGHFNGPIMPVTPDYKSVQGVLAYRSIDELPLVPDLAIICTRASRVPAIIMQLGRKGTRCAIVIASGLESLYTAQGTNLQQQMQQIAAHWNIRLLGPNSLGFMAPALGLNASYAHTQAQPGKIAFLSQSSAMCVALLDWSRRRRIGFSYIVSLGDAVDIDFDELIDYLGRDPSTTAILFYIDHITDGRAFLSAARAASFNKPLLIIKAGGQPETAELLTRASPIDAAHSSSKPLGLDAVYDAAFRRAGMLRVGDLRELMAAVETLANGKPIRGEQLVIVTNGNGPSAMAVDTLVQRGGRLEKLNETVIADIQKMLRPGSRAHNPINLLGDATPEEYTQVLKRLLQENSIENILLMHAPSALVPAEVYAQAILDTYANHKGRKPNLLVNWMGEEAAQAARYLFGEAKIASFRTPEGAIIAFMHMVDYRRNQKLLSETPESMMEEIPHHAQLAIQLHGDDKELKLSQENTKHFLAAYGLAMDDSAAQDATPLRIQVSIDPVFGPFIALGEATNKWHLGTDAAIALPPLNMALSRYLLLQAISKGKIRERDGAAPLNHYEISRLLTCVSQMVVDNPHIKELRLNPVWISGSDICVTHAEIVIDPQATQQSLAICPYPKELEENIELRNGKKILLRPIRPEDESTHKAFDLAMSKEDRYKRYFAELPHFSHEQLAHQTQIDYSREMAFIATAPNAQGEFYTLGVVRAIFGVDGQEAEFAMAVRSDEKQQGLGTLLLEKMLRYCRSKNLQTLTGVTMLENSGMANLARKLGFTVRFDRDEELIHMELKF